MKRTIEVATLQGTLFDTSLVALRRIDVDVANRLLVEWEHKLGPCNRPFHQEAFGIFVLDWPVSVAISASIVNGPVGRSDRSVQYQRDEVVELARQASCERWANRVMLRLWREVCAPLWPCWPVKAAVSYSHNGMHSGDMYRFDGWEKWKDNAGSSGGGTWGRKRSNSDAVYGPKSLWGFRYDQAWRQAL